MARVSHQFKYSTLAEAGVAKLLFELVRGSDLDLDSIAFGNDRREDRAAWLEGPPHDFRLGLRCFHSQLS